MLHLEAIGSVASIVGVLVSLITLAVVIRLRTAIKRHSRMRHLTEIIDRILRIPPTKESLPESTCREVRFVVDTARNFEFSIWFFVDKHAKRLADVIENELRGEKRRDVIQNNLQLLRDEITVR